MVQKAQKSKKHSIGQDVVEAEQRIAAHLRELRQRRGALDRDLLTAAAQKRAAGAPPTAREASALRTYENLGADEQWFRMCRRLPQQFLRIISGRQTKQLNEQAARYGLSIGGKSWDLPAFVLEVFALLAKIAPWYGQLEDGNGDAALLAGPTTAAMERLRNAKADLAEMERDKRRRMLLPRSEVRDGFNELAGFLREAGERIGREHGRAAQKILEDALEQFPRKAASLFRAGEKLAASKAARASKPARAGK